MGSITNLGFKVPYASIQCCNRSRSRLVCQRIIDIRLIRLQIHICRHSFLDFIYPVSSQIAQVSICFVTQRRCNYGFISFITQLILQCGDTSFIRSNICLLIRHIFGQTASCITYRGLQRFNIRFIGCHFSSRPLRSKRKIYFCLFVCLINRINLASPTSYFVHMHRSFRYAQSPAKERKRHERGEKFTSCTPPDFFRSGSRLGMRPSDFRSYHIAILCFRPDDFVNVVHNDFPPLRKNNEHFLRAGWRSFLCFYNTGNLSLAGAFAAKVVEILQKWSFGWLGTGDWGLVTRDW